MSLILLSSGKSTQNVTGWVTGAWAASTWETDAWGTVAAFKAYLVRQYSRIFGGGIL